MKNKFLWTAVISFCSVTGFAQAKEVETKISNNNVRALSMEIDEPSSKVEKALQMQLSQNGVKAKKSKGYYQYKNIVLSPEMNDSMNVYTKVEAKGKNKSVIYLAASSPNGDFITQDADSSRSNQLRNYLYSFIGTNNLNSVDYSIYQLTDSIKIDESNNAMYMGEKKKMEEQRDQISKQLSEMEKKYNMGKTDYEGRKQRYDDLNRQKEGSASTTSKTSTTSKKEKTPVKDK